MYIRLNYDLVNGTYSIPVKTDGTTYTLQDNHPAIQKMNRINPPHFQILPNYKNIIYTLSRNNDPFKMPFSSTTSYWIKN